MKLIRTKLAIITFLVFNNLLLTAQTDTLFWFVAPEVSVSNLNFDRPILLRLSTLNLASTVTIDIPANPSFTPQTINIAANSTNTVDLTTSIDLIENRPPNQILNKGIRIRSNNAISAYYEIRSQQCNCNPEIFALKGNSALGTLFYTPFQNFLNNSDQYNPDPFSAIDIVATEDNTEVTITPTNNLVGRPANTSFTITLNKGQTYSATAASRLASLHLMGTKVESNKPIAVTISDDLLQNSTCADLAGDQLIPVSRIGREYIITKGSLAIPDRIFVLAVEDNTTISVNGSVVGTVNKGQTSVTQITTASAYVSANKDVYVLHLTGYGCEVGMAILPPIECTGSTQVGFTRSTNEEFRLLIMVENGGEGSFTLNGTTNIITPGIFSNVQSTGGAWKYVSISLNTTQIPVGTANLLINTTHRFHLGLINGGPGSGTRYGYFSDFGRFEFVRAKNEITDYYCNGDTISLIGTSSDPTVNHNWRGPNGFSSTSFTNKIPNASAIHQGYYVLEMENSVCGSSIDSVLVTVATDIFVKPDVSSNASVCAGKKLVMSINNKPAGPHRTIWFNQNMDSIGFGDSIVFNPLKSTDGNQFFARYKTISGSTLCSGDTASVLVDLLPTPPTPTLTPNETSFCENETLVLSYTPVPDLGTIFEWRGPMGLSSDTTENWRVDNLNYSNTGFYYLRFIGSNGCESATDSVYINAYNFQESPTILSNAPVCEGQKMVLQINNKPIGVHRTVWFNEDKDSIGTGDSLVINNFNNSHGTAFYAVYNAITGSNFCTSDTTFVLADLLPTPPKPSLTPNKTSFCEKESLILSYTPLPDPGTVFEWKGPSGLNSDTSDNWFIDNLDETNTGFYSLKFTGSNGCHSLEDSVFIEVTTFPNLDLVNAQVNSPFCAGSSLILEATSTENNITFTWKGPNSFSSNNGITTVPNAHASMTGTYYLSIAKNNCIYNDTFKFEVVIKLQPDAAFTHNPIIGNVGEPVDFINQSIDALYYSWDFGDLSPRSPIANPSHAYQDENTYSIMLIAYNQDTTCMDTAFRSISVFNKEEGVYTPTGFSPNNDGKNDIFRINASGVMFDITLEVYNRWGELLFITENARVEGWDGTYMGKDCPEGIYLYVVKYKDRQGFNKMSRGTLTLLR